MSTPPRHAPPPEAMGPGSDQPDGSVTYGADDGVRAYVPPRRPAEERDRDMAVYREGCPRCSEVPADLIQALVRALREAKAGGRI